MPRKPSPKSPDEPQRTEPLRRERRANHEGTLEIRANGDCRYRRKINGVRVSGSWSRTRTEAKRSLEKAVAAHLQKGEPAETTVPTVADYAYNVVNGTYRERVKNGSMALSTWKLYEGFFANHLELSPLGLKPITTVRPVDIEEWAAGLMLTAQIITNKAGVSRVARPALPMPPNTKRRVLGFLSGIFTHARVASRLIEDNPVRDSEKPTFTATTFRVLKSEEIDGLIAAAKAWDEAQIGHDWYPPECRGRGLLLVLLGLHGLGPAEMCGLKSEDFDGAGIEIQRQARRGRVTRRLKTANRNGWVPVSDDLKGVLLLAPAGWVLRTSTGNPVQESALRRTFASIVKGTEFEGMKPYDLRHTFATRALVAGVDVRTIAELLRNTPEVVLRRYVKSERSLKTSAIDAVFGGKNPKKNPN